MVYDYYDTGVFEDVVVVGGGGNGEADDVEVEAVGSAAVAV
jgi:hypothetical protein